MSVSTESDWSGLLPSAVSARVVESAIKQSVVLQLATRQPMPAGTESVPVVSVAPVADFVEAGQRKPITRIEWSAEVLKAEEIACTLPIPEVMISDTSGSWDVEASVENEMAKAIGRRLDQAVLFGDNPPASWPSGGIVGMAGGPFTAGDALPALSEAMAALESEGIVPAGIAAGPSIGVAMRSAMMSADWPVPGGPMSQEIWGMPVTITAPWPASAPKAIVGGWENLLVGIREDINFAVSREGTLFDENGDVVVSAWQDDMVLCRIYARFGVVIARPLQADGSGPSTPFVGASWTSADGGGGNGDGEETETRRAPRPRRGAA